MRKNLFYRLGYILIVFLQFALSQNLVPELRNWTEKRFIKCVYCMNYDRTHISLFGCKPKNPLSCTGNACFMRFHKKYVRPQVMYTSGCLNLTKPEVESIAAVQKQSLEIANPRGTLLCELTNLTDTCICTDIDNCNFMDLQPDFSEYTKTSIFENVVIDDEEHLKQFLPNEYRKMKLKSMKSNYPNSYPLFSILLVSSIFHFS